MEFTCTTKEYLGKKERRNSISTFKGRKISTMSPVDIFEPIYKLQIQFPVVVAVLASI